MPDPVTLSYENEIAVVCINNPPVNALNSEVVFGFERCVGELEGRKDVNAVVIYGEGRCFVAGADIHMLQQLARMEDGASKLGILGGILNRIENLTVPVVAAIHGACLGGGLELAMACHYRIATKSGEVGQPEVKLGIIPGAGGTQRLPRLVGPAEAVKAIVIGENIPAERAAVMGLIDRIAMTDDIREEGIRYARELAAFESGARRTRERNDRIQDPGQNQMVLGFARAQTAEKAKGYLAPFKAIDVIETCLKGVPFEEGLKAEEEAFAETLASPQAKGLIHLFFATRESAKVPGITDAEADSLPVNKIGIVGAGLMGAGIAHAFNFAGCEVILKDVSDEMIERGLNAVRKAYGSRVRRGRMTEEEVEEKVGAIKTTTGWDGFEDVDLVVEAVLEDLDLKKNVFRELEAKCHERTILATNTSTLSEDEIASVVSNPERVVGLHFFSPVHRMRLLEIIRGEKTSDQALLTGLEVAKLTHKMPIVVRNAPGFLVNRILLTYCREAEFIAGEGATFQQVDGVVEEFGLPMGPFRMSDMAGLDVCYLAGSAMIADLGEKEMGPILGKAYELGRYGQKTGAGFYRYEEGSYDAIPDPEMENLVEDIRTESGIRKRDDISDTEIEERLIYTLINESARVVQNGIALRPSDVSVGMVLGTGFPPYRGGPLLYADLIGPRKVVDSLNKYAEKYGDRFRPCELLVETASEGRLFCN